VALQKLTEEQAASTVQTRAEEEAQLLLEAQEE
jgi:hypothetical protein